MGRFKNIFSTILGFIKRHKKLSFVVFIALAIILVLLFRPKNSNAITTETVKRGDIVKSVSATGKIDADSKVDLTFQAGGKLIYLGVKKGDKVSAGQVIATLDQATVEKNLKAALLAYSQQRNTFEQTLDNNNAKTINDAPNSTIKRILQNNQYDLEKAVNSVELQDLARQTSVLTTPISGVVTRTDVNTTGLNVTAATTFSVVDPTSLSFLMDVDETDIGNIKEGQDIDVSLDAFPNKNLKLTVSRIDLVSHTTSSGGNAFTVKATIPSDETYRVGMSGNGDIIISSKKDVLSIQTSDVLDDNYVYVKTGNKFEKRKIELGLQSDIKSEIISGLSEGEAVAIDPTTVPQDMVIK